MSERSLGDPVESEPTPETFDVGAFAAGHRPGRRSATVRTRLDLYPDLEAVVERINAADPSANVDALIDEFEAIKARMQVRFVFEQRSPEWVREFYRAAAADMGVKVKKGTRDALKGSFTTEQATEVACRIIAAQCLEPEGVTVEMIRELQQADPSEVDRLAQAVADVNAQRSEALGLDFSQRRSTSRGTPRT